MLKNLLKIEERLATRRKLANGPVQLRVIAASQVNLNTGDCDLLNNNFIDAKTNQALPVSRRFPFGEFYSGPITSPEYPIRQAKWRVQQTRAEFIRRRTDAFNALFYPTLNIDHKKQDPLVVLEETKQLAATAKTEAEKAIKHLHELEKTKKTALDEKIEHANPILEILKQKIKFSFGEDSTLHTIFNYMIEMTAHATYVHLQKNFNNPQHFFLEPHQLFGLAFTSLIQETKTYPNEGRICNRIDELRAHIHPDKLNQLTLLAFQEGSFYPDKSQGPLTEAAFAILIQHLELLAKCLPENLILVLSSLPVKKNVYLRNREIIIQCGKTPRIQTYDKVNPDKVDPEYPGTVHSIFTSEIVSNVFLNNLKISINSICDGLLKKPIILDPIAIRRDLISVLTSRSFFRDNAGDLIDLLNEINENLARKIYHSNPTKAQNASTKLRTLLEQILEKHIEKRDLLLRGIAPTLPGPGETADHTMYYSGDIFCGKTAGGQEFSLQAEICADQPRGTGKHHFLQWTKSRECYFPTNTCHIVTSNCLGALNASQLLAENYIHVDPFLMHKYQHVIKLKEMTPKPETIVDLPRPAFGSHARFYQCAPFKLPSYREPFSDLIESRNKIYLKIETIKIALNQYPLTFQDMLDYILQPVVELLDKYFPESVPTLKSLKTLAEISIWLIEKADKLDGQNAQDCEEKRAVQRTQLQALGKTMIFTYRVLEEVQQTDALIHLCPSETSPRSGDAIRSIR